MRTSLPFLMALAAAPVLAQCPFDATITPDDAVLCAGDEVELTTQAYDAYQWYRDGEPIPDATGPTLTVSSDYAGSQFSVEATLDGCTEMSDQVVVDGWVFLPPFMIHGGDTPYAIGGEGESYMCEGDTMEFTLGGAAQVDITWYDNGEPIPGETGTTLYVTTTGNYTASGAPAQCPNSVMFVGVDVPVIFTPPVQPEIVDVDGFVCPNPTPDAEDSVQWYLDGEPYSTEMCLGTGSLEAGTYTVFVDYPDVPCLAVSEPFVVMGVGEGALSGFAVSPVPAQETVRITWPAMRTPQGAWQLIDMTGRTVRTGGFAGRNTLDIEVRSLAPGKYWFTAPGAAGWKPVPVAVVR